MSEIEAETRQIIEQLMKEAAESVQAGDFCRFSAICHLPMHRGTLDGKDTCHTRQDLKDMFDGFVEYYRAANVTSAHRRLLSFERRDADTILCTHESWHLGPGNELKANPVGFTIAERRGGVWGVTWSEYLTEEASAFARAVLSTSPATNPAD